MKRSTRTVLIVCLSVLVFYFLLLVIMGISPQVNDRDLQVTREPVAEGSNCFALLESARSQTWWPEEMADQFYELMRDTNWNASLAAEVLQKNSQALASMDAALAKPACQVPPFQWGAEEGASYLRGWKLLSQLAAIRGNALFRAGKEKEAYEDALNLVRLGGRMQDSGGDLMHYLVGSAVKSQGLLQVQRWAGRTKIEARGLLAIGKELEPMESAETALGNTLKWEYQGQVQVLEKLRAGVRKDPQSAPMIRVRLLPVYNHGKTKRLLANYTRALITALPSAYSEVKMPTKNRPSNLALICSGNLSGEVFYWLTKADMDQILTRKSIEVVTVRATRIQLALRAYQLKNGKLPPSLSALVPDFLDEVPLDDFDGKPMRYSLDRKVLYSVGEDLRDDGGKEEKTTRKPDYVFSLNF